jgi:hypothetical protein
MPEADMSIQLEKRASAFVLAALAALLVGVAGTFVIGIGYKNGNKNGALGCGMSSVSPGLPNSSGNLHLDER